MRIKTTLIIVSLILLAGCQKSTAPQDTSSVASTNTAAATEYEFHYENIGKEFNDVGMKISLPATSEFNFFTNQEKMFEGVIAFDTEDADDVNAVAYGDGFMFITSAVVWDNDEGVTLKDFVASIAEHENVLEEEDLEIDGFDAKKLVVTSFGNREITVYYCLVDGQFYAFSAPEGNLDVLEQIVSSVVFEAAPQPAAVITDEKNVYDYFLEIPDEYFFDISLEDRIENITVRDENNYYIAFEPYTLEGNGSFAIFLNGDEKLFVTEIKGCGPICEQEINFLKRVNGKYVDVTDQYMPVIDYEDKAMEFYNREGDDYPFNILYELPRFGTSILIKEQMSQEALYSLKWQGGKFILQ